MHDHASFLVRVTDIIEACLADPSFDVGALAGAMGMSRSGLHRRLVESGGTPPGARIRRARMARAEVLLRTTDRTVRAVARAVGYRDPAHFTRSFKRDTGMPPTDFRAARNPHGSATEATAQRNGKGSRQAFNRGDGARS